MTYFLNQVCFKNLHFAAFIVSSKYFNNSSSYNEKTILDSFYASDVSSLGKHDGWKLDKLFREVSNANQNHVIQILKFLG